MSDRPAAVEAKATRLPSGESEECETASPGTAVIWRAGALPSTGIVHKFRLPLEGLLNSNVRPSRETKVHSGAAELSRRRTACRPLASGSEPSGTLHTSRRKWLLVTINREPSADTLGAVNPSATVVVRREMDPSWMSMTPMSAGPCWRGNGRYPTTRWRLSGNHAGCPAPLALNGS